jgi:hypothetical protein
MSQLRPPLFSAQSRHPDATVVPLPDPARSSSRIELPIAWDVLDHSPSPQCRESAEHANAIVFSFLFQGVDIDAGPRPADEHLAEALAPLRIKLDTIIELLTSLSYRAVELPPRREIEIHESRLVWEAPRPLHLGDWLRIRMYFHATFREPIIVFGKVTNCGTNEAGSGCCINADLATTPKHILGDLSRLAFLLQRRQRGQRSK